MIFALKELKNFLQIHRVKIMRTRFIYSKRGGACFVPHIALAQMFSRSASRAGMKLIMTQGFSQRAKISFAPELPAGVVALNEPVDMFFEYIDEKNIIDLMNNSLPEGFNISRAIFPDENSPALGKLCKHAEYLIRNTNNINLNEHLQKFFDASILKLENINEWLKFILKDPAQNPIGGFVKFMIKEKIISGWHEMNIVRTSIGFYDDRKGSVFL